MPFFLILPIWFFTVLASTAVLFVPRLRFLSTYLFFGSTLAVATSFAFSTAVLLVLPKSKLLAGSSAGLVVIIAYLAAIGIGGAVGLAGGLFLARTINRRVAWFSKLTLNSN